MERGESYILNAARQWAKELGRPVAEPPKGLYNLGVHASLQRPNVSGDERYMFHWSSYEYDFRFESAFDDTTTPTEGEITLYNLTDETIGQIETGLLASCTGGYGVGGASDQGVWLYGWVTGVETEWDGPDKLTSIHVVNVNSGSPAGLQNLTRGQAKFGEGGTVVSLTYSAPVAASFILRQLCEMSGLPIAEFAPERDRTFTESVTVEGDINQRIAEFASICGVWAYLVEGILYVKNLRLDPYRNRYLLSEVTGLVGTPTPWREEVRDVRGNDGGNGVLDTYTGYKVRCLLNHRMVTGVGVELEAKNARGVFAVKSGKHVYDGVGGYTQAVLIG